MDRDAHYPRVVIESLEAVCDPPTGWRAGTMQADAQSVHQVWVSPSGCTAYGVIRFSLPLPVGPDAALWGFLREMRRSEGEATLISKTRDPDLGGLRFDAEGGRFYLHAYLVTDGWRGWTVYAGTRRDRPFMANELDEAENARENTALGDPR